MAAALAIVALALALLTPTAADAAGHDDGVRISASTAAGVDARVVPSSLAGFDPGNIISDALFYDANAMSAAEIQSFLDQKIGACRNGKCLNVVQASISNRAELRSQTTGALVCGAIQGGTMRASELIYRVQRACEISAKVILVTLQKEQGLVTSREPSDWNLRAAMGAYCPDTAPCDPAHAGLGPQIYKGVQQLKTYKATKFSRQPGRHFIGYNPNASCGGTYLDIANYATAALYNYTPYQPNAAALGAGYGLGDRCSTYGNRNFYNYYTDWFGSTQSSAALRAVGAKYESLGGAAGPLGAATAGPSCGLRGGGCYQDYQNGRISWSAASGAHVTKGGIQGAWARSGYQDGPLGYPTSDEQCGLPSSGCYQEFESGKIYWTSATDARTVRAPVLAGWSAQGYERGQLGYPTTEMNCGLVAGGCYQEFQGGEIHWSSATGAHSTRGDLLSGWAQRGYERGVAGYPASEQGCGLPDGGCYQEFQRGKLYWSPVAGAQFVKGGILGAWGGLGYERGWLGYPAADEACGLSGGGCMQRFLHGALYWSAATDAQPVHGGVQAEYEAIGGPRSKLGYPLHAEGCGLPAGGCYQEFGGGKIYWSPAHGAYATGGGILHAWAAERYERGPLGYPTSDEQCGLAAGGCSQDYENGVIYWTAATDARAVSGRILEQFLAQGGPSGPLGYPVENATCEGTGSVCTQRFQNGSLTATS